MNDNAHYDVKLEADVAATVGSRELTNTERFYAVRFVRDRLGLPLVDGARVFKELLAGGSVHFETFGTVSVPVPFLASYKKIPNEYEAHSQKQTVLYELMKRGAAGDAEAAIAYCKAELNHEVSHGAMG